MVNPWPVVYVVQFIIGRMIVLIKVIDTLPDSVRNNLKVTKGSKVFKFGSRNKLTSVKRVVLPCIVAGFRVNINEDIFDTNILLLLSKSAMEKAKVNLNFDINLVIGRIDLTGGSADSLNWGNQKLANTYA